jgi:hypothetical protein
MVGPAMVTGMMVAPPPVADTRRVYEQMAHRSQGRTRRSRGLAGTLAGSRSPTGPGRPHPLAQVHHRDRRDRLR